MDRAAYQVMVVAVLTKKPRGTTPEVPIETLADDCRPIRIVARNLGELMRENARRWMAALDLDRLDSLIITVVLTANIAHVPGGDAALSLANEQRRSISPMAISDSMQLAYETVRRRVKALINTGLLIARADGVIVASAVTGSIIGKLLPQDAEELRAVVMTLAAQGHELSARVNLAADDALLARALIDLSVRMMQRFVAHYGGLIAGSVLTAIIAANVRHLIADPDLARRYATSAQIPPDEERRPVAIRTIARELQLPYETVRRQAAALVARGAVELGPRGAIVPSRVIAAPEHEALNRFNLAQYERMLVEISRG